MHVRTPETAYKKSIYFKYQLFKLNDTSFFSLHAYFLHHEKHLKPFNIQTDYEIDLFKLIFLCSSQFLV